MSQAKSARLTDIAALNPQLDVTLGADDLVAFVPMAAVDAELGVTDGATLRPYSEVSKGFTPFRNGDLLVAKITPCFENGKIGQARLDRAIGFGSTEFHVVRPHPDKADARYLLHFLRQDPVRRNGEGRMTGSAGQRRVPEHFLESLRIPLPSLNEQRRIATILDRADALRARRRAALAQLDALTQALFFERFVGRGDYPSAPLAQLCELITDGTHYTPTYSETGVIFLSSRNITSRYIDWSDVKFVSESLHRELHRRVAPRFNDVLLAKNGTTGIAAVVDRACVFDIYVSLALLRPTERILPIFLREALNSAICKRQFDSSLKGIGVPNLHLKDIRRATIPVPDLRAQKDFVECVLSIEAQKQTLCSAADGVDALFASLQHRAFRGDL